MNPKKRFIQINFLDQWGNVTCSQEQAELWTAANYSAWFRKLSQLDLAPGSFEIVPA